MQTKEFYKEYFTNQSKEWLEGAYEEGEYNYPVGKHRLRLLKKLLKDENLEGKKALDIGCGGGDISFYLAERGAYVTGIDMSTSMLDNINNRKESLDDDVKGRLTFRYEDVSKLSEEVKAQKYDIVVAFGLIGYLESDEEFFHIVSGITTDDARLFVSFRNRCFNLFSISPNTLMESADGDISDLIEEYKEYYECDVDEDMYSAFLDNLECAISEIRKTGYSPAEDSGIREWRYDDSQPRQSTPKSAEIAAGKYGFILTNTHGIHPHIMLPQINKMLSPQMYNRLSDALIVMEDEKIALTWSSVFVGEFVRGLNIIR